MFIHFKMYPNPQLQQKLAIQNSQALTTQKNSKCLKCSPKKRDEIQNNFKTFHL